MKLISFDIETWGLQPGRTLQPWHVKDKQSGVLTIAATSGATTLAKKFPTKTDIKTIMAANKGDIFCGWNLKFDLSFLLALGMKEYLQKFRYLDGMLLLKRMGYDLPTYALKPTLRYFQKHLDVNVDYSKDIKFKIGKPQDVYSPTEMDGMLKYNIRDADYTLQLIKYLSKKADNSILLQAIRESTSSFLFADAWQRGILLDEPQLEAYSLKLDKKVERLDKLLLSVELTPKIIASPKQLQSYISNKLGIKLTERTQPSFKGSVQEKIQAAALKQRNNPPLFKSQKQWSAYLDGKIGLNSSTTPQFSVGKDVLNKLYFSTTGKQHQVIRLIRAYKKLKTETDKFVNTAKACLVTGDRVYPEPILSGTYTGRLTYSIYTNATETKHFKNGTSRDVRRKLRVGVPMHQIKKAGAIRKMFVAPKDHSIVELDFSNQEMRLIACVANEPTMIKLFNENKDLHAYTGAGIIGMQYDEFLVLKESDPARYNEMRKLGKLTNLALQYRLSATGLYKQWHDTYGLVSKTQEDAMIARSTYMRLYSGIPRYWDSNPLKAQRCGYAESMGGRRCSLTSWNRENIYRSSQTAINFPIQATGADQKILAIYCLRDYLHANGIQLAWDLHDGLFFYVPDCMMQHDIVKEMVDKLDNLPYQRAWGWQPQVKFPVEAKIGKCWGELKELNL